MGIVPLPRPPQALQVVELARPRRENVNDEIDIVQKDPLPFGIAFDVQGSNALPLEYFFDVVCNRLSVPGRCAGTNEEVIGEGAQLAKFEHHRVKRLLVECCLDGFG